MNAPLLSTRPAQREAGFTLIEVLIALALLAIMVVIIAAAIRSSRFAMAAVERLGERSVAPLAQDYLRSALLQTQTFPKNNVSSDQGYFSGDDSTLEFVTSYSVQRQVKGLYRVSVFLIPSQTVRGAHDLVVQESLFRPERDGIKQSPTTTSEATLIAGIQRAVFSYFGEPNDKASSGWQDSWIGQDSLPSLVRIKVIFPKGDDRLWPTLTVPLASSELPM